MDDADRADAIQTEMLQRRIANSSQSRPDIPYAGECYNCLEPLNPPLRFCDADCRDDYAKRRRYGEHT